MQFRFAPVPLRDLVYAFWESGPPAPKRWATMRYLLIGGKIDLAFEYPDKLVPDEDVSDRRPRVIRRHFGDATIDYSRPNGP